MSLHTQLIRGLLALPLALLLLVAATGVGRPAPASAACARHALPSQPVSGAAASPDGAVDPIGAIHARDNARMFDVVLHQPEIPPNTGNVIRLCANTGARLHLVEPLGFSLDDKQLRRAGLDYHEYARLQVHDSLETALSCIAAGRDAPPRVFALSTRGQVRLDAPAYAEGDVFLFGAETRGLPDDVLAAVPPGQRLRLPMRPGNRSLNLANAVAVVVFEAWRQHRYTGGA